MSARERVGVGRDYDEIVATLMAEVFELPDPPSAEYLANLCHTDPKGCFVSLLDGTPVGFAYLHTMGSVGHIGPIGVRQPHRGAGYGRDLVGACVEYLRERCDVIGAGVDPRAGELIGLLKRCGFVDAYPGRRMVKDLPPGHDSEAPTPGVLSGSEIPEDERKGVVALVRSWTRTVYPALDLTKDIDLFLERYPDRVLFHLAGGRPRGVLGWHSLFRDSLWAVVEPGDDDADILGALLAEAERRLSREGRMEIGFHTSFTRLTDLLLDAGYLVAQDMTCMLLKTHRGVWAEPSPNILIRPWWAPMWA